MIYHAMVVERPRIGVYSLLVPGVGSTTAPAISFGSDITYSEGDEVYVARVGSESSKSFVILGYVTQLDSEDIVGDASTARDDIQSIKGLDRTDGDIIFRPHNSVTKNTPFLALMSAGASILQASNNSYALFSGAGKATIRTNFLKVITATHSHKSVLYSGNNVAVHSTYKSGLSDGTLIESIVGYTGEAPILTEDSITAWQSGLWYRLGQWGLVRADDVNSTIQVDIVDSFIENKFVSAVTRSLSMSKDEFSISFGVKGSESSITLTKTGIEFKTPLASYTMGVDGVIEEKSVASSSKCSDDSFIVLNKTTVAIAGKPTIISTPIDFSEKIVFNRAGILEGLRNFYYDSTKDGWNFNGTLTVNSHLLIDERFLTTKWDGMLKLVDQHIHTSVASGGPTSSPAAPVFWSSYSYVPAKDKKTFTSSFV